MNRLIINKKAPLDTIFWGYHESGFKTFSYLLKSDVFNVIAVVLPTNREHETLHKIKAICKDKSIVVLEPSKVKDEGFHSQLRSLEPDLYFVDSYTKLIPKVVLEIPQFGGVNLHPGLLPDYKGAHTLNWCIVNGAEESGLSLHVMNEKFDDGPLVASYSVKLSPFETAKTLDEKLHDAIPELISKFEEMVYNKVIVVKEQEKSFKPYRGRKVKDGEILDDFDIKQMFNLVRAISHPWPGAFKNINNVQILIWEGQPTNIELSKSKVNKVYIHSNQAFIADKNSLLFELKTINEISKVNIYSPISGEHMIENLKKHIKDYEII